MNNPSTPKEAIRRSITHNEIASLIVNDLNETFFLIEEDEHVSFLDYAKENNGDWNVWGTRLGEDFRICLKLKDS